MSGIRQVSEREASPVLLSNPVSYPTLQPSASLVANKAEFLHSLRNLFYMQCLQRIDSFGFCHTLGYKLCIFWKLWIKQHRISAPLSKNYACRANGRKYHRGREIKSRNHPSRSRVHFNRRMCCCAHCVPNWTTACEFLTIILLSNFLIHYLLNSSGPTNNHRCSHGCNTTRIGASAGNLYDCWA